MASFSYVQTFYINPEAVENAGTVMLKNIELFFKSKPSTANISGAARPGVTVFICETAGGSPVTDVNNIIRGSITRLSYDFINATTNATTGTVFRFRNPVPVLTGKTYGIVVEMEDPAYDLWINTAGNSLISATGPTTTASAGSSTQIRGQLFRSVPLTGPATSNNTEGVVPVSYNAYANKDLKFSVRISKFVLPDDKKVSVDIVIKNFEFLSASSITGTFKGGEWVYQNESNKTGAITVSNTSNRIVGTGTTFSSHTRGQHVVFTIGANTHVLKIDDVINDTLMTVEYLPPVSGTTTYKVPPVARAYSVSYLSNTVILVDSSAANSTFKFGAANTIIGASSGATCVISSIDKFPVDKFVPRFRLSNPSFVDANTGIRFSYNTKSGANWINPTLSTIQLDTENRLKDYRGYIHSRSLEVSDTGYAFTSSKSVAANVTFTYQTTQSYSYQAPFLDGSQLDLLVSQYYISNTNYHYTNQTDGSGNSYTFSTETTKNGLSKSKYISKKISFAPNRSAEDVVAFITAYRPKDSNIEVYVKLHNSADTEAFDDKTWTPLSLNGNPERYSETESDYMEYQYSLPASPETKQVLTGNFSTTLNSNVVTTSVNHSSTGTNAISSNTVILLYDELLPDNRDVFIVTSANSTAFELNKPVSNNNLVSVSGAAFGFIKVAPVKYPFAAFNNIMNDNVARYITSSLVEFDRYNSMQVKVVVSSNTAYDVPILDSIQVIGVSS